MACMHLRHLHRGGKSTNRDLVSVSFTPTIYYAQRLRELKPPRTKQNKLQHKQIPIPPPSGIPLMTRNCQLLPPSIGKDPPKTKLNRLLVLAAGLTAIKRYRASLPHVTAPSFQTDASPSSVRSTGANAPSSCSSPLHGVHQSPGDLRSRNSLGQLGYVLRHEVQVAVSDYSHLPRTCCPWCSWRTSSFNRLASLKSRSSTAADAGAPNFTTCVLPMVVDRSGVL